MLRQAVLMAFRVLAKNWLYTLLSVASLIIGITAFLTNLAAVERIRAMDRDLTHYDRIYHIYSHWLNLDVARSFATSPKAARILETRFPEFEQVVRLGGNRGLVVTTDRARQYEPIYLTDPNFFEVFDYEFIDGNPATALTSPFSAILSESAATRYFGNENAVGKTVTIDGQHVFTVTAVIDDLPRTSHLRIGLGTVGVMVPFDTYERLYPEDDTAFGWGADAALTFALVPDSLTGEEINNRLTGIVTDNWPELFHEELEIEARPLGRLFDDIVEIGGVSLSDVLLGLGAVVLLVACANFASLVFAQNVGRAQEVALRKAVGGGRGRIVWQFFIEGLVISGLAVCISIPLIPVVLDLLSSNRFPLGFDALLTARGAIWLVVLAPVVTLIGCLYPALRVSSQPPGMVFRQGEGAGSQAAVLRMTIVVFQFVLAIGLFIGTAVTLAQQRHLMNFDLQYAEEQVLVIDRMENPKVQARLSTLKERVSALRGVAAVAASSQVPSENTYSNGFYYETGDDPENTFRLTQTFADPEFFDIYDISLRAGRMLTRANLVDFAASIDEFTDAGDINAVINMKAVEHLGWDSAAQAVGQSVVTGGGKQVTVVGVVENKRIRGAGTGYDPTVFMTVDALVRKLSIELDTDTLDSSVQNIERTWNEVYPEYPMEWKFLDERFAAVYEASQRNQYFLGIACLFAFLISCLGLFGLAGYVAETRTKEIGIRKVMGASAGRIVRILLWDFSKPILIAAAIVWPIAYLALRSYLDGFAERIDLSPLFFVGSGGLALGVAWLVVAAHVWRAARTHPAHALRHE